MVLTENQYRLYAQSCVLKKAFMIIIRESNIQIRKSSVICVPNSSFQPYPWIDESISNIRKEVAEHGKEGSRYQDTHSQIIVT